MLEVGAVDTLTPAVSSVVLGRANLGFRGLFGQQPANQNA